MTEDSTELFYANMEADRNAAAAAYFDARPEFKHNDMIDRQCRRMFEAGYERAYRKLWDQRQADPARRWEWGFRDIVTIVVGPRTEFEIKDIVEAVRAKFRRSPQSVPEQGEQLHENNDGV